MRDLRVVGVSDDGRHLLLASGAAADSGGAVEFQIPVDGRLRAAVRGHLDDSRLELRGGEQLTPREIQARIRAGESVAELAQSSGVPLDRLVVFAHPVLAERAQAVQDARATRAGDGTDLFGELVDDRLRGQDVDLDATEWDAWRGPDGRWTVQLVYPAHGRLQCASWCWDPAARRVLAADAPAESLLRGGPAAHGAASVAARQAALFGTAAAPTGEQPIGLPPAGAPAGAPAEDPADQPAELFVELPEAPAATGPRVVPPLGRTRRAAVPSWTQIRGTARMPTAPAPDAAD